MAFRMNCRYSSRFRSPSVGSDITMERTGRSKESRAAPYTAAPASGP
jgi:hypothetical protein